METEQLFRIRIATDEQALEKFGKLIRETLGTQKENIKLLAEQKNALKDVRNQISELDKMEKVTGKTSVTKREELIRKELEYKQAISETQMILKNQEKLNQSVYGSMQQQSLSLEQMRMAWRKLKDEQKESSTGKDLLHRINELDGALKKNDAEIGNHQRNVGNYGTIFGKFTAVLGGVTGTVAAAVGVFKMVEPVFESTRQSGDELNICVAEIDSTWQLFMKSIAAGDMGMFINNLDDAVSSARELAEALNEAASIYNSIGLRQARASEHMEVLREKLMNTNLSSAERKKAYTEYKELLTGFNNELTAENENLANLFAQNVASKVNFGGGTKKEATEKFKNFVENYNTYRQTNPGDTQSLMDKAKAYNAAQDALSSKGANNIYTHTTFQTAKQAKSIAEYQKKITTENQTIVDSADDATKSLARLLRDYGETNEKEVKLYVDAEEKFLNSKAATARETRRIDQTMHSMERSDAQKAAQETKKYSKIHDDEVNADKKLSLSSVKLAIAVNQNILNDDKKSYNERISALHGYHMAKKQEIDADAENEIDRLVRNKAQELNIDADSKSGRVKLEKLLSKQIANIRKNASLKIVDLENETTKKEVELKEWGINKKEEKLAFEISLMKNGSEKELAQLELQYAKELRMAEKNGTDVNKVIEKYQRERKNIKMSTPEGQSYQSMSMAGAEYKIELDFIDKLDVSQTEKDKRRLQALYEYQKALTDTQKQYIETQYQNKNITIEQYKEQMNGLNKTYASLEKFQSDIQNGNVKTGKNGKIKKTGKGKVSSWLQNTLGLSEDNVQQLKEQSIEFAQEIGQSIISIQTEISQRKLKLEQERIDAERDSELKSLELRYNKGLMSEKAYNKAVEATNAEADRKKEEAEREAFEREKRLKIMGVAIDTAAGIIKVWSEAGLIGKPWAIAQTAFLTASGIAQTAVIASQQFAQGGIIPIGDGKNGVSMGMLQGPSHSQGGIPLMVNGQPVNAEVEGGEILAVINKRSAAQYLPLFSAINATNGVKFENGGVIGSGWSLPTPAPLPPSNGQMLASMRDDLRTYYRQTERMIKATTERIDNIKVHVVEKDITKTQKKVASIRAKATIIGGK